MQPVHVSLELRGAALRRDRHRCCSLPTACSLKALADLFALDRIYNEIIFRWVLRKHVGWAV